MMRFIFTIIVSCISLFSLHAQVVHGETGCNNSGRKQDMAVVHSQKIAFFTQYLDLSPQEAAKFWPVYNEYWKRRGIVHKNTKRSLEKLNSALNSEAQINDDNIKVLMDNFLESYKAEGVVFTNMFSEIQKVLPLRKAAKLVSVEEEFRVMLIRQLKENKK